MLDFDLHYQQYVHPITSSLCRPPATLTVVENTITDSLKPAFTTGELQRNEMSFTLKNLGVRNQDFIMSRLDNSVWVINWYVNFPA
jgi:hypothetical protein